MTDCPTYSGWSITKSSTPYRNVDFKVVSRLLSFNFVTSFFCWIATAKPIQAVIFVLFVPLFRPVAAGSLRQSCPAFSHRSRLPFRFVAAGSLRQSYPAYSHRSSSNFRFIFFCWIATATLSSFNFRSLITN